MAERITKQDCDRLVEEYARDLASFYGVACLENEGDADTVVVLQADDRAGWLELAERLGPDAARRVEGLAERAGAGLRCVTTWMPRKECVPPVPCDCPPTLAAPAPLGFFRVLLFLGDRMEFYTLPIMPQEGGLVIQERGGTS
jgi:hypothetical protein